MWKKWKLNNAALQVANIIRQALNRRGLLAPIRTRNSYTLLAVGICGISLTECAAWLLCAVLDCFRALPEYQAFRSATRAIPSLFAAARKGQTAEHSTNQVYAILQGTRLILLLRTQGKSRERLVIVSVRWGRR